MKNEILCAFSFGDSGTAGLGDLLCASGAGSYCIFGSGNLLTPRSYVL